MKEKVKSIIDPEFRKKFDVLFCFGDRHYPHHDEKTDSIVLQLISDLKPDIVIDGGDMIDAHAISVFAKSPESSRGIADQIKGDKTWRSKINAIVPGAKKIVLYDNHFCRRLDDFLKRPDTWWLSEFNCMSIDNLFQFSDTSWELLDDWIWKDKFMFMHGDADGGCSIANPVNKARNMVKRRGIGIVRWHSHGTGVELVNQFHGPLHAIQMGIIMDPEKTEYVRHKAVMEATQSVGVFYLSKQTNDYYFDLIPIVNHKAAYMFREYLPK